MTATISSKLKKLVKRTGTPWLSDHLCWGSVDGTYTHDLLPMPYTFAAARRTAEKIRQVCDFLEVPICVENVSSYAEFHVSEMTEWEFLTEVVERADCGILLDVNNIYVSSATTDSIRYDYVDGVPHHRVAQMHIAGHSKFEQYLLDTHDHPVIDPVWKLYAHAIGRCGLTATLLEWDDKIPSFEEVHAEAIKAKRYWSHTLKPINRRPPMQTDSQKLLSLQRILWPPFASRFTAAAEALPRCPSATAKFRAICRAGGRRTHLHSELEARERLELYHRQYWFRLLDSIDEDFPALKRLLGKENFWRLIEAYLEPVPSRSFTLRHLGSGLADFMTVNPGLAGGHPVQAAELAQLEYALCDIFEQPKRPAVAPKNSPGPVSRCSRTCACSLFTHRRMPSGGWMMTPKFLAICYRPPSRRGEISCRRVPSPSPANGPADLGREFSLSAIRRTASGSLTDAFESSDATPEEVGAWFKSWTEFGWLCELPAARPNRNRRIVRQPSIRQHPAPTPP